MSSFAKHVWEVQLYRLWRTWTHMHTHTYTHRSVFKYSDIPYELFAIIIWENIVNNKTNIVPAVWISGSIACVYCSIGHVLKSTAWKLGKPRGLVNLVIRSYVCLCHVYHKHQAVMFAPFCIWCLVKLW